MADDTKQKLGERLSSFLKDVVTLDVLTLSGTIALDQTVTTPAAGKADDAINWDELFGKVTGGMSASGNNKLKVVAYTHAQWDCDSVNFVKEEPTPVEMKLIENHGKAVEAAHRSRYEALKFIGDTLKSL